MEWYNTTEDFKKQFNKAEELKDEELDSYKNVYSSKGVAYALDYVIEYRVAITYSRERLSNVWNCVYKLKPRESTVIRGTSVLSRMNLLYFQDSDIYIQENLIARVLKRVLDDKIIGGEILINGKSINITTCEYYDLLKCFVGDLECLK